ncbi:MAG: NAD(P)-dependent oxidoreductase [Dietzia sp.]|uniref:NAD(P)-dependent oxidoreductase n=1 Tax=Dietzia sp. TaxID=1871616 RepID=UPI001984B66B|nr:NAD(P)-dependent oxidoreductase [Dietzia sp.]MBC7295628.1 uroporphyrin-III methyltransferase [Dietzia sp.]MDO8392931.1 NAD(P)-dependent oxidoreductase [Dietzia sp.]
MTIAFADAAPAAERPAAPALDGLPLTVGLSAREVLVVGAGPVSVRRAETFLEAGAVVRVVAPRVDPAMADLAARAGAQLVVVARNFRASDLDTPWMVHVATGDPVVDAEVAALCEQRRIWCVAAGDAALGSARVPARTAVSTPAGLVRIAVDSSDPRRSVRVGRHVARSLATAPAGLRARRRPEAGWLVLVGGCGDGDLLTVRARRFVHAADVLVVDGAADPGLLAEIDDDVEVIEVGSTLPVDAVARVVAARCAAGHGVVRIVAADTLADRARDLRAAGVEFEIVPGVIDGGA